MLQSGQALRTLWDFVLQVCLEVKSGGDVPAAIIHCVGLQFLGTIVFGYFALVSLLNARLSIVNRNRALAEAGPAGERDTARFLRFWVAANLISFVLLTLAAVMLWVNWGVSVALAAIPVGIFAAANLKTRRRNPKERS